MSDGSGTRWAGLMATYGVIATKVKACAGNARPAQPYNVNSVIPDPVFGYYRGVLL